MLLIKVYILLKRRKILSTVNTTNAKGGDDVDEQKQKVMQATAERIRHLRKQRDFSQEELALRSGINTVYYGQIERGQKCPTVDVLYRIASGLEIPLAELLRFDVSPPNFEDMTAYMEQLVKRVPPSKVPQIVKILEAVTDLL